MKRKIINMEGSALVFTVIVFAALMILSTFTLSFMVTENTHALHHQNKTQAYYYARSGVEIVEEGLIEKLNSFSNDVAQQKEFVDRYNTPHEIDVDLEYLNSPIVVKNEMINGKKVLTVTSTVTHNSLNQTVKKGIYSTSSMISSQGFLPGAGELMIYLGDVAPQEKLNNGKSRFVPSEYVRKVPDDEKDNYKAYTFPNVDTDTYVVDFEDLEYDEFSNEYYFSTLTNTIDSSIDGIYIDGDLRLTNGIEFNGDFNIYVNGKLDVDGTIEFNGKTDLYVKETVYFGNNIDLKGFKSNNINQIRIFTYNELNEENSMTNFNYGTTSNNGKFRVYADLYINSGNINLGFPQDSMIDGHIVYNGTDNVNIKTNSNSYNDRLITGHIYAPFGTVNLGIHTYQVATILGGQIIADSINVFPNNVNQGNKFYENSTEGRIENNPIPIDITEGIDTNTIRYDSFFIE